MDIHAIVSELQHDVANTYTIVSHIHRVMMKVRGGIFDGYQLVAVARAPSIKIKLFIAWT